MEQFGALSSPSMLVPHSVAARIVSLSRARYPGYTVLQGQSWWLKSELVARRQSLNVLTTSTFCRFPGQEHTAGSSKVPSIICYDNGGTVRAAGAEVNIAENVEKAEDEGWMKAEWCAIFLR